MRDSRLSLQEFYKSRTVLVTGHTGFKGSWLCLWLKKMGAHVIGYSLKPPTDPSLFEVAKVAEGMVSVEGDVCDHALLAATVIEHKPDIVIHMAAQSLVRRSYDDPIETYRTNVLGTVNMLDAVRVNSGVRALVNVTSDKCYEPADCARGYKETDPLGGCDPYSSSKGCAELVTKAYIKSYFSSLADHRRCAYVASARAGNVIGGGDWSQDRLIPDCVRAITAGRSIAIRYPDAVRPWQHVLEPLGGYLVLARRLFDGDRQCVGAWNFGPSEESLKSVRWLAEKIVDLWGQGAHWVIEGGIDNPYEAPFLGLDSSKAAATLSWHPRWTLAETLQKTVEWYKVYYGGGDVRKLMLEQIGEFEEHSGSEVFANEM